jgi:hypothetical protein
LYPIAAKEIIKYLNYEAFNKNVVRLIHNFISLFICLQINTQNINPELTSLNLLQGDILLCGNGDFGIVDWALSCSYETRDNFYLAISLLHSFEHDEDQKAFCESNCLRP